MRKRPLRKPVSAWGSFRDTETPRPMRKYPRRKAARHPREALHKSRRGGRPREAALPRTPHRPHNPMAPRAQKSHDFMNPPVERDDFSVCRPDLFRGFLQEKISFRAFYSLFLYDRIIGVVSRPP